MLTNCSRNATARPMAAAGAAVLIALSLAGCANSRMTTGSINRAGDTRPVAGMSVAELQSATTALGQAYARKPGDKTTAMRYAGMLQATGRTEQSLAVMRKLAIAYPEDREVLAAYGKALAALGEFETALDAIRRAQTPEYPDWRLLSAEGAILDQLGQQADARKLYRRALDLQPDDPSVLSNLGMSYLLEGDLKTAETHLRRATENGDGDSRVRQNLALVVGLQGRFEEAEQIAAQELSPEQAEANIAYLRSMLAQRDTLAQLRDEDPDAGDTN